jgi:hypothetical protein
VSFSFAAFKWSCETLNGELDFTMTEVEKDWTLSWGCRWGKDFCVEGWGIRGLDQVNWTVRKRGSKKGTFGWGYGRIAFIYLFAMLGFELRAWYLLDRNSTICATSPAIFYS